LNDGSSFVKWARNSMLSFETPLANAEDMDIPQCVGNGDEAIAIIRERYSQWVKESARKAALPG
jgi:hypothetical protein